MRKLTKMFSLLLATTMFTTGFATSTTAIKIASEYADVLDYVQNNYVGDVSYQELSDYTYKGILGHLDEYSEYLSPAEYRQLEESQKEEQFGSGMRAYFYPKICKVVMVYEGGPAERAGIKVGDEITYINGAPYKGYYQFEEILSKPSGTEVRLAINRNGETIIVTLKTENYNAPNLYTKDFKDILNDENGAATEKIRYMKIEGFTQGVSENFKKALSKGKADGIRVFVVDLRGNLGGSLEEIMLMFDQFIPKSDVVKIVFKNDNPMILSSNYGGKESPFKFVVLTDNLSASASELFTATIKEKGVGKSVGFKTFGKGVGQDWITLTNGGAMILTTFEYRTAKDTIVNKIAVSPDVKINAPIYFTDYYFNIEDITHVQHLNEILRFLGYKIGNANVYGIDTRRAIEDIQLSFKLYDTGYITSYELMAINSLLKDRLEPQDKNNDQFIKEALRIAKTLQ